MQCSRRAFLSLGGAWVAACAAARVAPTRAGDLDGVRRRRGVPGVAVAIVRGDQIAIEAHGSLLADATAAPVVEVASLSKPVFAYAVCAAAARGELELDASIERISPPPYRHARRGAVDAFDDARLADVTPRRLLAHRSGLPNWARDRPLAFEHEPGPWSYSGEGYVLLQRVLEGAGQSLEDFTRAHVLAPLGMDRSTFDPSRSGARAPGHDRAGAAVPTTVDAPIAATSLLSTIDDYGRFARRLATAPPDDRIVGEMLARQIDVDPDRRLAWGTGIALAEPEWFFHWGVNPGFRTLMVGSRARRAAVVVLTDSDGGMELAADVVRDHFGALALLDFPMLYPPD